MFNAKKKQVEKEQIAKDLIARKVFGNSRSHRKIIMNAARKSSEDQAKLVKKYDESVFNQR